LAGWLALAVALTVVLAIRGGRMTAIAFTALLTAVAGLSRIDLRARCASGVLASEALAVMRYALDPQSLLALRGRVKR
jgi:hypothetical protein